MLVARWYNTTQLPPAVASSSPPRCTRARNRVLHASLVEPGGCTVGAEFCAERQTIAAKWLNCSQLNKCSNRICPLRAALAKSVALLFSPSFFLPLLRGNSFSYVVLVSHASFLLGREGTYRSGVTGAQVKRRLLHSSFLIPTVMRSRVRANA